ncbi:MAG: FecR domain-containing protein [Spirochaetota bacterium]
MVKLKLIFIVLSIHILAIACKESKPPQQAKLQASVSYVKGKTYKKSSQQPVILKLGDRLQASDEITTSAGAYLELQFPDAISIRIGPNSNFNLRSLEGKTGKDIQIFLKKGSIFSQVPKLKQKENFRIVTESSTAGIRGTKFYTKILEKEEQTTALLAAVTEGSIVITPNSESAGKSTVVEAGEQATEISAGVFEKVPLTSYGIDSTRNQFGSRKSLSIYGRKDDFATNKAKVQKSRGDYTKRWNGSPRCNHCNG